MVSEKKFENSSSNLSTVWDKITVIGGYGKLQLHVMFLYFIKNTILLVESPKCTRLTGKLKKIMLLLIKTHFWLADRVCMYMNTTRKCNFSNVFINLWQYNNFLTIFKREIVLYYKIIESKIICMKITILFFKRSKFILTGFTFITFRIKLCRYFFYTW